MQISVWFRNVLRENIKLPSQRLQGIGRKSSINHALMKTAGNYHVRAR